MLIIFQIDFKLKHVLFNDVIAYEKNIFDLINLIETFQNVFQDFDTTIDVLKKNECLLILSRMRCLKLTKSIY